jgi:hypothetical protein
MKVRRSSAMAGLYAMLAFAAGGAWATVQPRASNIVELVGQSDLILQGTVAKLSDGIDERGIPYTEVTLHVADAIRGQVGSDYTFRQFGLLKPRKLGNGLTNIAVTPAGWATYRKGEETILFLYQRARWTGLQTTVGLGQGQFKVSLAGAKNFVDNAGLFEHMQVDDHLLSDSDRRVMNTGKGAVNAKAFVALVRKMVADRWIEQGGMRSEPR